VIWRTSTFLLFETDLLLLAERSGA